MSGEGFLDKNKGKFMPRGSSVKKDNSTESKAVATIEKGFNLTIFLFISWRENCTIYSNTGKYCTLYSWPVDLPT